MPVRRAFGLALLLAVGVMPTLSAQMSPVDAWRATRERAIVDELMQFVALPNIATSDADMRRNAILPRATPICAAMRCMSPGCSAPGDSP